MRERRGCKTKNLQSRVSVPNIFFDIDGSEFSALLPPDLHRLHGTVSYVSKILRKISVTWDVDNSSSYCRFEDVQLEVCCEIYFSSI